MARDADVPEESAEAMKNQATLPAVTVMHDGKDCWRLLRTPEWLLELVGDERRAQAEGR
jgi:hypothetical protein